MILDKQSLPDDPTPTDAPPSYDTVTDNRDPGPSTFPPEKLSYPAPNSPPLPYTFNTNSRLSALPSIKSPEPIGGKNKRPWYTFGQATRTQKEVKATVIDLLRDLVKQPESGAAPLVLESCVDACRSYDLSLSSILQERCIEDHSALYWAVIKRPTEPPNPNARDFLTALLCHAAPLSDATISELRLACLQSSDQALFQRLKRSPAFSRLSGTEIMLLGETITPDDVEVENAPGEDGAFVVRFRVPMFQKRMQISEEINLEFIARGRMWSLKFYIASRTSATYRPGVPGSWNVSLTLMKHSTPTYIDSRVVIEDANSSSSAPASPSSPSSTPGDYPTGAPSARSKPTICLRLKCRNGQIKPEPNALRDDSTIFAPFQKSLMANCLQYDGSTYIGHDGSLSGRLEATLGARGTECIIC